MAEIGKVTSFVTRMGPAGPQVCVFSHPYAGVQLPAGTLLPGEDPVEGARREVFEETGIGELTLVREIAGEPACPSGAAVLTAPVLVGGRVRVRGTLVWVLDRDGDQATIKVDGHTGVVAAHSLCADAARLHIHFVTSQPTPDEWWVVTPDGGGHCWRCHWLPVEDTGALHPSHRPWLERARRHLVSAAHPPAVARPVRHDTAAELTVEIFWAPPWSATRALVSWLPPEPAPPITSCNGQRRSPSPTRDRS